MTTLNDDHPATRIDETTPLPTTPAPSVGQDATIEMPTSSPISTLCYLPARP